MSNETTDSGMLGGWQRPIGRLEVCSLDFAHLEAPRVELGMLEARALAIYREGQGAGAGDLHPHFAGSLPGAPRRRQDLIPHR